MATHGTGPDAAWAERSAAPRAAEHCGIPLARSARTEFRLLVSKDGPLNALSMSSTPLNAPPTGKLNAHPHRPGALMRGGVLEYIALQAVFVIAIQLY